MSMALVISFFKALPELVTAMKELKGAVHALQDARLDKIEQEINTTLEKIKNETDRQKLLDLVATLNNHSQL